MNLKVLFGLLAYYSAFTLMSLALSGLGILDFSVSSNLNVCGDATSFTPNNTNISAFNSECKMPNSSGTFGILSFLGDAIIIIIKFLGFIAFGIGLPFGTPSFIMAGLLIWQTLVTMFSIGFIISGIWDG